MPKQDVCLVGLAALMSQKEVSRMWPNETESTVFFYFVCNLELECNLGNNCVSNALVIAVGGML